MCVITEEYVSDRNVENSIAGDPTRYDAIEVHGACNINEENDPDGAYYVIDNTHPEIFSVYLHCVEGGIESVGNFLAHSEAMEFANDLSSRYQWRISNFYSCPN